ncbi:MAG TPA: hypothetical protein VFL94_03460 [Actinomycetales bacterium]|nr:hypothetical protein [Actinomycetales bacterium]
MPGCDTPAPDSRGDAETTTGPQASSDGRTVRELILELSQTEDALRDRRALAGRGEVPVPDVHALLGRQRELVAELRRLSGTLDLIALDAEAPVSLDDQQGQSPQLAS